jgi:molecular chaperone DnaK (HSP70)
MSARFLVGIDLGTTHTVVAYAPLPAAARADPSDIRVHSVRQWVAVGEIAARTLLPTCLYAALPGEADADPWGDSPWVIGELGRRRGQELLGRLVVSAKSWLCHGAVDRLAPILPWGTPDDEPLPRVSPVEASARVLRHLVRSWNDEFPEDPLAAQEVVLTVPASFDEVARELTVRAAVEAGLDVRLLEEPQAAFYDYLEVAGTEALEALGDPALVLVCDVGGGTTDLTLIEVRRDAAGRIELERLAVGRHLLLGGDNMDLALAHACEPELMAPPARLDARRFAQAVLACRAAKELLLSADAPPQATVTVLGAGSDLFAGRSSATLGRDTVEELVLGGFFPEVPREAQPSRGRSALLAFGLPYESDPAITRHVASFLRRHLPADRNPAALLLNGGVFRASRIGERVRAVVESWARAPVVLLPGTDPELAVARGAVAYGLALAGRGLTIGGGTARGYYVGIDRGDDRRERLALCLLPRGTREGQRHLVADHPLALTVGRPVRFDLYASDQAMHRAGEIVTVGDEVFDRLPPVAVTFGAAEAGRTETLRVVLEGELSPLGTLELGCVEAEAEAGAARRFRLAFDLRSIANQPVEGMPAPGRVSARPAPSRLAEATAAIERVFGKSRKDVSQREVKDLWRTLEKTLGERADWTTEVARVLGDELVRCHPGRRRSADHERVFWMLTGFCLRPGFGHPDDPRRLGELGPLFSEGLAFAQENRGWQQFFIAWRRLAGGLGEALELGMLGLLEPALAPGDQGRKRPRHWKPLAPDELVELVSWLERVPAERRAEVGRQLVERTWTRRDPRLWAAIGRVGARIPAYASLHHVVSPRIVERWLDHLLREKWDEVPTATRAALDLARVTGDRARDLGEPLRLEVAVRMQQARAPEEWVKAVRELVPVREADRLERFGEDLPVGLRLVEPI